MCYMDTHCFILSIKTDYIYKDISEDVGSETSNYELMKSIGLIWDNGLMKNELGRTIRTKFVGLRAKTFSYLIDNNSRDKKAKGTKNCVIKRKLKFENYKNCSQAIQLDNKINYTEKKLRRTHNKQ